MSAHRSRLRWHCRRGCLELDIILERYLDRAYDQASLAERADFEQLLELEDRQLQRWFIAEEDPHDPDLQSIVDAVRAIPANRS